MCYALTFLSPKFYGMTENYVGVIVFVLLVILFLTNVNIVKIFTGKEIDGIILAAVAVITGINLLIVNSGLGAFFVVVNFAMIFYLSDRIVLKKWQLWLFAGLYVGLLLVWFFWAYPWMFADYTTYALNTNTAATFTIFTILCAFVFAELLFKKHEMAGLLMVVMLLKAFQIGLYHRARGAFIMLIAFIVFRFIVPKKWWSCSAFYKAVCYFVTIGSLAFVAFYVVLGTTGTNFKIPFFYKNLFSGREKIWLEFWNLFVKKPLTGIGTNVTIESFFEFNVHNAMYDILVIHGVVVFVGVLVLMYRKFFAIGKRVLGSTVTMTAIFAIFAVCLESFFDVDLIWTDYSINVLFLMLVASRNEQSKESGENG